MEGEADGGQAETSIAPLPLASPRTIAGRACLTLKISNVEQGISNIEVWGRCAPSFFMNKNDRSTLRLSTGRIPYFDIQYSTFDIRY
jgi:hypothetical protein